VYAPIALFVYNRPLHAQRCLSALSASAAAGRSDLYVFSDGPRSDSDVEAVRQVRELVGSMTGFASVTLIANEVNQGLAASVIKGVTSLVERFGCVIVVEDDLVVAPDFLEFMNAGLDAYAGDERVAQVSGHQFPVDLSAPEGCLFLPITTSWGWATWARAWKMFDPDATGYARLRASASLRRRFTLGGAYDYFGMLERQRAGEIDSWAIRWQLSVFLAGGLTLYPAKSLVTNIGFDGSGTHCKSDPHRSGASAGSGQAFAGSFPAEVAVSQEWEKVRVYLRRNRSLRSRLWSSMENSSIPLLAGLALAWKRNRRGMRSHA
jgi:hypothetical protein